MSHFKVTLEKTSVQQFLLCRISVCFLSTVIYLFACYTSINYIVFL